MAQRLRNRRIEFKVTDSEYELMQESMRSAGYNNMREYLSDLLINGYVVKKSTSNIEKLVYEINKIGTNINQAVHLANIDGTISKDKINKLTDELLNIRAIIFRFECMFK